MRTFVDTWMKQMLGKVKILLLEDEELSTKSGLIYKIFESKMGTTWGTFLVFREVLVTLLVKCIKHKNRSCWPLRFSPCQALCRWMDGWMFRFNDTEGTGQCVFEDLEHILSSVFQFYLQ